MTKPPDDVQFPPRSRPSDKPKPTRTSSDRATGDRPVRGSGSSSNRRGARDGAAPKDRESSVKATLSDWDDLVITPLVDQDGNPFIRFDRGRSSAVLPAEVVGDGSALSRELTRKGIRVVNGAARGQIQALVQGLKVEQKELYVARAPGYHCGAFVMPNERMIGTPDVAEFVVRFDRDAVPLSRAGSYRAQQATLRLFGLGQSNMQFCCALALVGPALDLMPYPDNVLIDMAGGTSSGKTRALLLASCMYGALLKMPGSIAATWRMTDCGMEHLLFARAGTFLPIDEVNAGSTSRARQAELVGNAAFTLGEGSSRVKDRATVVNYAAAAILSTANIAMSGLFDNTPAEVAEAAGVRFITVPADAGAGLGVWDRLPRGFTDPGVAADALTEALKIDHGWIAERFIRKLCRRRRRDPDRLRAQLREYTDEFMQLAAVAVGDGVARRRASKFAIIYAAGQLAVDLGVLPFPRMLHSVLAVYRRAEALRMETAREVRTQLTPLELLRRYAAANAGRIVDLDRSFPHLSEDALNQSAGFLKTIKARRYLLLRRPALLEVLGPNDRAALKDLEAQGRLLATEAFQVQTRVRHEAEKDRVYAIMID